MKHFYYLLILFSTTVSAKHLEVSNPNYENNLIRSYIGSKNKAIPCELNVIIGGTLDDPTSIFFVTEEYLNGIAPYTYLLDGNPSPNANLFFASTLIPGIHLVEVTDANGCKGSATFYSSRLSTSNFSLPNFKCYPNPAKNLIKISNTAVIDEINLISINGNMLLTKQINNINSEIDLSNFSKGIYFLKIIAEGTEKTIKLVKE